MHRILLTSALCLALGACATAASQKLAVCDGKHRRPASPNGSVLAAAPPPVAAPSSAAAPSFAPCGGRP